MSLYVTLFMVTFVLVGGMDWWFTRQKSRRRKKRRGAES